MWVVGVYCSGVYCYWVDVVKYGGVWVDFVYIVVDSLQVWDGVQCVYNVFWFQCIGNGLFQVVVFVDCKIGDGIGFIVVNLEGNDDKIGVLQGGFLVVVVIDFVVCVYGIYQFVYYDM